MGSDTTIVGIACTIAKFQSTLPVWGATFSCFLSCRAAANFNPRSPCGERQTLINIRSRGKNYFNPRSPCGERRPKSLPPINSLTISIHAPRVGSDLRFHFHAVFLCCISIHAPRVGSDAYLALLGVANFYFNPRSPCGERLEDLK